MELTLDQALQKGVEAHKAGEVQEADQYYTAILKTQPKHPDANHNMGVLAVGLGKIETALPFFKTALEVNPNIGQFWLSYIDALIKLDRMADAKAVFDQAKSTGAKGDAFDQIETRLDGIGKETELNPSSDKQEPFGDQLQGLVNLYTQGQYQQALNKGSQLQQQFPRSFTLYNIIGAANKGLGKLDEAIEAYNQALSIKPDYTEAYNNMGNALKEQGKLKEAIESFNQALDIKPDSAAAYYNMGNALKDQGKLEEALEAYTKAISLKPDYADAHNNIGLALQDQGKLDEAIEAYNRALTIKPDYAHACNNMGIALKDQGKLEKAIEAYTKAISLKPSYGGAYNNMGNALKDLGKLGEAAEAYTKALSLNPDYAPARYSLALLLYQMGKYKEAASHFSKNGSSISQTWLMKCLYELNNKSHFYEKLDYLISKGENNATIGSYTSRSNIRYGVNRENPFCNEPLKYVVKVDLLKKCDFQEVFVKGAVKILNEDVVQKKRQTLVKHGTQTAGNVFGQIDQHRDKIQDLILMELENFRQKYKDSGEGLITSWPSSYRLNGWIVKYKNGGAIKPHMHEDGWISGSVYINVPPELKDDSGNLVVCVESEREQDTHSKSIDVVTGSLCLFPSSLLHYTIPFKSEDDRIVLAFDVVPNK